MNISIVNARGFIRKKLVELYQENPIATSFLSSFFKLSTSTSLTVSIEVERAKESVAVDVVRGTEGNRNSFDTFSEKQYKPPYYREYFDATDLSFYDRLFGQSAGEVDARTLAEWTQEISRRYRTLQNMILRRKELQAAQVLQTGIVELVNGDNIDFKRKGASIVDLGGGSYWSDSIDPLTSIQTGCDFSRQEGKAQGGLFNMILGSAAISALLNNDDFIKKANLRRVDLMSINTPQTVSDGKLHGEITVGSYIVRIWSYPEFYTHPSTGVSTAYVDPKKMILVPENPIFTMAHAGVPVTMKNDSGDMFMRPMAGEFVFGDYIDQRLEKHIYDVKSAFVAIPTAVDTVYTAKVLP